MLTSRRSGAAAVVLAAVVGLMRPGAAAAQDNPDAQMWIQMLAVGDLANNWRTHIEVQPRFMDDASELGLTLIRTALGRSIAPRLSAWIGHAWVPRTLGADTRHEQRIWQQLLAAPPPVSGWTPSIRFRMEQRWLAPWNGVAHRLRLLTRAQRTLGTARRWGVFAYDEVMVTLDRTPRGPSRGYDRNRLSAGVVRRFSPTASTDVGYIWENTAIVEGRRNEHIFVAVLNLAVPRR